MIFFSPVYNKYQLYASDYKNVPFILYKVTRYEDDLVDIEKIERNSSEKLNDSIFNDFKFDNNQNDEIKVYTEEDHLSKFSNSKINSLYEKFRDRVLELGDIDIDVKKVYIAFKGRRNIVDVEFQKNSLYLSINAKIGKLKDENGILKTYFFDDGRPIGHHGNGDYYYSLTNEDQIDKIIPFIKQSYEINKK